MPESVPAIRTHNLQMQYAATRVLDDVTLTIDRGEVVALLGPNGAGKTTTIEILEGFRVPSGGEVSVLGETPHTAGESWRARVGVVLQSWRDHGKWRVEEFLDYLGLYYTDYATPEVARPWPTADLLERVGLAGKTQRRLDRLSGGERRRLDVAVGLLGRPEVLFLDEPTAGFDPQARRDFHELIRSLSDLDTTILLTTHDLAEAELLADRILVLAGGSIVADGTPDELRHRMSATASVRFRRDGELHTESTDDPVGYLRGLFARPGEIADLEVRRASLEEAYLTLVHQVETGADTGPATLGIPPGPEPDPAPDRVPATREET
ncbi:ABC transporter ATP-binding protein [Ornithinimicrobium cavernae]|uniref:ABC transporter ATP-binding protein n=1 Tax=Ornithinimicrobium cavernae TaxID=2666047 RepID=UPI00192A32B1|nr:ABC transporter ATP-binding protein [Ornithinimicrobium cavernae]